MPNQQRFTPRRNIFDTVLNTQTLFEIKRESQRKVNITRQNPRTSNLPPIKFTNNSQLKLNGTQLYTILIIPHTKDLDRTLILQNKQAQK